MLYTSYFANIKKLPQFTIPVSIALKPIPNWSGLQYRKVSPTEEILNVWKQNHDIPLYCTTYKQKVLDRLTPGEVVEELQNIAIEELKRSHLTVFLDDTGNQKEKIWESGRVHIALLCYEKSDDFCHRHLLSKWLSEHGYSCSEYMAPKTEAAKRPEKYKLTF